jgi:colanic acid biosynthesis glycosyl transferase WcaI
MPKIKNNKKVLVVCQHYWPETFRVNDICDFLTDQGCEIDVLCGLPNYPEGKLHIGYSWFKNLRQIHNGVNIMRAWEIPRGNNSNFRIFLNYVSFPFFSLFYIPYLLTKKYDKVLVFTYSPIFMALTGIIVGKLKRTEVTLFALDLWPENLFSVLKVKNKFLRKIATAASHWHYRRADKIVAATDKMRQIIIDITSLDDSKAVTLPQASEKVFEKQVHDKKLAARFSKGFNIVFTGNISPAQSFETIISAAKKLKNDGINDINWIIVGDGMSRKGAEARVKKAGLAKEFYFEGFKPQEDIPRYTGIADALVGGLVKSDLLEASIPAKVTSYIAAGRPMVMYLDGEARDLINKHAKSGFAGPTEDANTLAENVKKVYKMSSKERAAMGKRARDYHFKHLERNVVYTKLYRFIFS